MFQEVGASVPWASRVRTGQPQREWGQWAGSTRVSARTQLPMRGMSPMGPTDMELGAATWELSPSEGLPWLSLVLREGVSCFKGSLSLVAHLSPWGTITQWPTVRVYGNGGPASKHDTKYQ